MSDRVRGVGPACLMYKLDLSRGYRQLLLDSLHWLLISIRHEEINDMDVCPHFGLRTAGVMVERTTMAASYIHGFHGFLSQSYTSIDNLGGA